MLHTGHRASHLKGAREELAVVPRAHGLTRLAIWQVEVVNPRPTEGLAPGHRQPHAARGGAALRAAHVPPCAAARQGSAAVGRGGSFWMCGCVHGSQYRDVLAPAGWRQHGARRLAAGPHCASPLRRSRRRNSRAEPSSGYLHQEELQQA